jgi:zinc protease
MKLRLLSIAFFLLCMGSIAHAQKKPDAKPKAAAKSPIAHATPAPQKITSVEGITEYQLANGLRVLLFPDPSKPTITVNITYLVGSRMEGYGETGMAHLLEHMVFKGSTKHTNIPQELTSHGASPNGTTDYDRTNYFESFQANDENLNWALDLESDRMVNSFIAEKDLRSEFSVVRNEFESGENNPSNILMERVLATMYIWHNYGKVTIGSKEDIEKVPIKNLQAFYHKYYQPDNAVLLVAGKIDEEKTLALINKYFGAIAKPTRVIDPTYTIEPEQDGERSVTLRRVGDAQVLSLAYHICSGPHPDYEAFDVLNEVLTNNPNGRLYQDLVKTGLASGVWSWDAGLHDPGFLYINADVLKEKSLDSVKSAMLASISNFKNKPVNADEVDKAKSKLLKDFDELYRNSQRIGLVLSEFMAQGDWRLAFLYRDRLKKVTADDVNRVAKEYLIKSNRTMGEFIPTDNPKRVKVPETPDVAAAVKDYKGEAALTQAEAFDPSPDNIEKRTEKGSIAGGAKYALLAKSTRGNTVEARITLRMGTEKSLENKATISQLTAAMLKKGTKSKNLSQINEAFDKLSSTMQVFGGGQTLTISITSTKEKLPAVLDLMNEILRQPSFPDQEFKELKEENINSLEQQRSEPQSIASREFSRLINPHPKGNIKYEMSTDEEIDAIKNTKIEDLKAFYTDFYNSSNATIAFVGDFDANIVKEKLNNTFANWTAKMPYAYVEDPYIDIKPDNKEIKTPDKKNAMLMCGMSLKMRDDNGDYAPMMLGNFIFGGGFLNSRLAARIRQKEGISYGVGSFFSANPKDESGVFGSYAIYNPDNKAKLEAAWNEELTKMLKEGFAEDELKQAKSGIIQYRQNGRASDAQLASKLASNLYLGRTMAWDKAIDERLEKLSVAEVNNAMKKFIFPEKISFIKVGDFK